MNNNQKKTKDRQSGFTLVELLVVIAIIGALSSVILVSLNRARVHARDAQRREILHQIDIAMQLYFETNKGYMTDAVSNWEQLCITSPEDMTALVTAGLLSKIPCNPANEIGPLTGTPTHHGYFINLGSDCNVSTCSQYCVFTNLETTGVPRGVARGGYVGCPGT